MKFDNLKKGAEDAFEKTVDVVKNVADNKIAKDIKKGTEEVVDKTVEGAKGLADKVTGMFKK